MAHSLLERIAQMALETGGTVKVDFKAWDPLLHAALCGVPNGRVLETLRFLASLRGRRPDPPLLVASTLLVPGYVTPDEVGGMAGFLAALGRDIPYRLLCFAPQHAMVDLPTTSADDARGALAAANRGGLASVSLGNLHLLR
jgi:pyruvate formate lyase activating enzyme